MIPCDSQLVSLTQSLSGHCSVFIVVVPALLLDPSPPAWLWFFCDLEVFKFGLCLNKLVESDPLLFSWLLSNN